MEPRKEEILQWFAYDHLPEHLQTSSKVFADIVAAMLVLCPTPSAERTVAFRNVLNAKDAFVRASILDARARKELP